MARHRRQGRPATPSTWLMTAPSGIEPHRRRAGADHPPLSPLQLPARRDDHLPLTLAHQADAQRFATLSIRRAVDLSGRGAAGIGQASWDISTFGPMWHITSIIPRPSGDSMSIARFYSASLWASSSCGLPDRAEIDREILPSRWPRARASSSCPSWSTRRTRPSRTSAAGAHAPGDPRRRPLRRHRARARWIAAPAVLCGAALAMVLSSALIFIILPAMVFLRPVTWRQRVSITLLAGLIGLERALSQPLACSRSSSGPTPPAARPFARQPRHVHRHVSHLPGRPAQRPGPHPRRRLAPLGAGGSASVLFIVGRWTLDVGRSNEKESQTFERQTSNSQRRTDELNPSTASQSPSIQNPKSQIKNPFSFSWPPRRSSSPFSSSSWPLENPESTGAALSCPTSPWPSPPSSPSTA